MTHALQETTTPKHFCFFILDASDTSPTLQPTTCETTRFRFHGEESSTSAHIYRSTEIRPLVMYESYRKVVDSFAEGTWGDTFPPLVVPGQRTKVEVPSQPVAASKRNEAAIILLESWVAAPDTGEDDELLEAFINRFDEDRLSERKLFP